MERDIDQPRSQMQIIDGYEHGCISKPLRQPPPLSLGYGPFPPPSSIPRSPTPTPSRPQTTPIMSIQQRSKSAPQLAVSLAFQPGNNTTLSSSYRREQSFVHPPITLPSTSRPRDEPFALSGFFPSYISPLKENDDDERWNWLRGDEEEDAESAYTASEEDPTVPPTPVEYDENENLDRVIQREDKLGILGLREYQIALFPANCHW